MDENTRRQVTWVLVIGAIACIAVIASYRRGELDRLAATIADGSPSQRVEAVRTLVAKQKLREALEDRPRWVQDQAISAIPLVGTHDAYYELLTCHDLLDAPVQARDQKLLTALYRRGVEIFIEASQDKDGVTRGTAKAPLTNIGTAIHQDDPTGPNPVVDGCLDLLDAWDQYVRDTVRDVLAVIPSDQVTGSLVAVMKRTEPAKKTLADGTIRDETTQEFMRARGTAEATLVKMQVPAIEPIIQTLVDHPEEPDVRATACRMLGAIANRAASPVVPPEDALVVVRPLLRRLTSDDQWGVRRRAATALGLLGDVATEHGVVPALISRMQAERDEVKAACAESLGKLLDPRAIVPLVDTLINNRSGATREIRLALTALGNDAIPATTGALASLEPEVRLNATQAIAQIGGPSAVVPLASMLKDRDVTIRRVAADALRDSADARVLSQVAAALGDSDWQVYHAARDALANVGTPAIPILLSSLGTSTPRVSSMAKDALVRIGEPTLPSLRTALLTGSEDVALWAGITMGEIGSGAVEYAAKVLGDRSGPLTSRAMAARALGRTGAVGAVEPLVAALAQQEPAVKVQALYALDRLAAEEATPAMVRALGDRSPQVRDAAMDVLRHWRLGDVEKELASLAQSGDENAKRRATVVLAELTAVAAHDLLEDSLGASLGQQETGSKVDVATLAAAAQDGSEDPEVRRRAIVALGYAGSDDSVAALTGLLQPGNEFAGHAAMAVARIGDRGTVEIGRDKRPILGAAGKQLFDLMMKTNDEQLKVRAAAALSIMGEQPVQTLLEALKTADDDAKVWIVATLGAVGKPATDPVLEARGVTRDQRMKQWLAASLECIGDAQALDLIRQLAKEDQPRKEDVVAAQAIQRKILASRE